MLRSDCCSGKLDNNNTRATVGGRDTVSLVKTCPSLFTRKLCTLGLPTPSSPLPTHRAQKSTRHGHSSEGGRLQRAPGTGGQGTLTKDAASVLPPSLLPSLPPSFLPIPSRTLAMARKVGCIWITAWEGMKSLKSSLSSPVRRRREPEQPAPAPRAPAPPHPAPAAPASPRERRSAPAPRPSAPAATGSALPAPSLPPPPRRIRGPAFSLEPSVGGSSEGLRLSARWPARHPYLRDTAGLGQPNAKLPRLPQHKSPLFK